MHISNSFYHYFSTPPRFIQLQSIISEIHCEKWNKITRSRNENCTCDNKNIIELYTWVFLYYVTAIQSCIYFAIAFQNHCRTNLLFFYISFYLSKITRIVLLKCHVTYNVTRKFTFCSPFPSIDFIWFFVRCWLDANFNVFRYAYFRRSVSFRFSCQLIQINR